MNEWFVMPCTGVRAYLLTRETVVESKTNSKSNCDTKNQKSTLEIQKRFQHLT